MKKQSKTGWAKIKSLKDKDIDLSDIPELDKSFFAQAKVWSGTKKQLTIRLDPDVVDFFKKQGHGYQTRINIVLRRYMEGYRRHVKSKAG